MSAGRPHSAKRTQNRFFSHLNFLLAGGRLGRPEQEQGLLRVTITLISVIYLLFSWPASENELDLWLERIEVALGFLVYSAVLLTSTIIWPEPSIRRQAVSVIGDIGITTVALHLAGPTGAPWYGVYLWVTLGNGFRYGEKFLYLSGVASLLGFGLVVFTTPYWEQQTELAIGLAVTLLVIPAYSGILIRRLNQARRRADAASRAKGEFLSRMSHEIRTPLNGILGMTDLLRTRPLDPEDREYVETIHASGKTLAHQIDEILDLSKIEAGKLSLEMLEFDLYALINTTLRIFEPQVKNKQLQLQEMINPKTPFLLYGDPHKLRQIIINLVGNAVKFTEHGFVSLRVYPREQDDDGVTLRFEVADTGTGIPADRLERIFDPFAQADCSVSRSYGGTGLGTTICKRLIEVMDGEIGVQSTLGVGTTFWFDITFETGKPQDLTTDQSWVQECNVVYLSAKQGVDDTVVSYLRDWQIPFQEIQTMNQALSYSDAGADGSPNYDAMIVNGVPYDEEMERLLSKLDGHKSAASIPVVLLGAENYPPELGRREHDQLFALHNPLDKSVLFNTLHACYSRHSTEDDVIHIAHKQVTVQRLPKSLSILIGDDNATNRLVLQRMLKKMGYQCTAVSGGEAVLTALEHSRYDIAIVDKNMPDMNGIDVFTTYSMAHGGRPPTTFVILTADATAESRDNCMDAGIEHFLTKPVSLAKLQETFVQLTSVEHNAEQGAQDTNSLTSRDTSVFPVVDEDELEKLRLLAGDDKDFMQEVVANFENDANRDIRELEIAVANRDWIAFKDAAHALKGAALYLGLHQLVELAIEAQILSQEAFEQQGIAVIQSIRKATDSALGMLRDKLRYERDIRKNTGR